MFIGSHLGRYVAIPRNKTTAGNWGESSQGPDGRRALAKLARDSFDLRRLSPQDATLRHPNWADCIAALPFLPTRPTRRQVRLEAGLLNGHVLLRQHSGQMELVRILDGTKKDNGLSQPLLAVGVGHCYVGVILLSWRELGLRDGGFPRAA